ncbi:MAG: Rieske (2Fe-2S) protein, partial [Planctomycetota bacterium]
LIEIEVRRAKQVVAGGRALCVIRTGERSAQIFDDACPHVGLSLSGGKCYEDRFVCPWHAWEFRVVDGTSPVNNEITVRTYPTRINERGIICLGVPRDRLGQRASGADAG